MRKKAFFVCLITLFLMIIPVAAFGVFEDIMPLSEVKPGMPAYGMTVFKGWESERFNAEVVGISNDPFLGPMIVVNISGGPPDQPIEKTGIVGGMSGSPIFIDGKNIGCISYLLSENDTKCYVTPIEDQIKVVTDQVLKAVVYNRCDALFGSNTVFGSRERQQTVYGAGSINRVLMQWRNDYSMKPAIHISAGVSTSQQVVDKKPQFKPGSSITIFYTIGDVEVRAIGTVSYVKGNVIFAFGHAFELFGETDLPFAQNEVLGFVKAGFGEMGYKLEGRHTVIAGTITKDGHKAIAGVLGQQPRLTPVKLNLSLDGKKTEVNFGIINATMAPSLISLVFNQKIDELVVGRHRSGYLRLKGGVAVEGASEIKIDNIFEIGEIKDIARLLEDNYLAPLYWSRFVFKIKKIELAADIDLSQDKVLWVESAVLEKEKVGEKVKLKIVLRTPDAKEKKKATVSVNIPKGVKATIVLFDAASFRKGVEDGQSYFRMFIQKLPSATIQELVDRLNNQPLENNKLYVAVVLESGEVFILSTDPMDSIFRMVQGEVFEIKIDSEPPSIVPKRPSNFPLKEDKDEILPWENFK